MSFAGLYTLTLNGKRVGFLLLEGEPSSDSRAMARYFHEEKRDKILQFARHEPASTNEARAFKRLLLEAYIRDNYGETEQG